MLSPWKATMDFSPAYRRISTLRTSRRILAGSLLLLLEPPAFAQTSKEAEPPVEIQDVYNVGTPGAATAASSAQPTATPPATKPPTSTLVPVAPNANAGPAPAGALPTLNAASAAESSNCNNEPDREGFYLRLAYGFGAATFRGQSPNGSVSVTGLSSGSAVAIGASLMRGLVLAGTIQSAQTTARFEGGPFANTSFTSNGTTVYANNRATASFTELGALVDWYPKLRYGLHTGLTVGLGSVSVANLADNSSLRGANLGGSVFLGYDWSISRYWAIGLELLGSGAARASLRAGRSRDDSGYTLAPLSLGFAASLVYF